MPPQLRFYALVASAVSAISPVSAYAQRQPPEIVVTGERQPRTREQTASSVEVFDAADIQAASGADRIEQILGLVANVQLGSGGEGPTIRGQDTTGVLRDLPAFLGGNRPRTTLQVDGRPASYNEFAYGTAGLWDTARVEVFRSPQTTTQGRNSIAGAIFVETADPSFDWLGRARLQAGSLDLRQASAAVSGPLLPDQLAVRLSADVRRANAASVLSTTAVGIDPNRNDYNQLRLKVLAVPAALPGLRILATGAYSNSQSPQLEGVRAPFELRRDPEATYGVFKTEVTSLTVRAEQELGRSLVLRATGSLGDSFFRRFAPAGFGETQISGIDKSLELIATWRPSTVLSVILGGAWSGSHLDQQIDLTAARIGRGAFVDEQRSLGYFSQAEMTFASRFEVSAGARYQRDRQVRTGVLGIGAATHPLAYDGTFEAILPKVSVAYRSSQDSRVGILIQRAYNPGGTTLNLATFAPDIFEAEYLWDVELFARSRLMGGALQASANVFNYWIDNSQRSLVRELPTPGGIVTFVDTANAPRAWTRGAELELNWNAATRLQVSASVGVLATRLTEAVSASDPLLGKEFQRSPHLTGSLALTWKPMDRLTFNGQYRYHSRYFSDDSNDPARWIAPASTVDARAEWRQGPLRVFGYVRNVFDDLALTYLFAPASRLATANEPRQFGIGVDASF